MKSTFSRTQRFRVLLVGTCAASLAVGVARDGWPNWETLAVFVGLAVVSEGAVAGTSVAMPSGFRFSTAILIETAAVVAFGAEGSLSGPMLVAIAGVAAHRIRGRRTLAPNSPAIVNGCIVGLAAFAAGGVNSIAPIDAREGLLASGAVSAAVALTFVVVNGVLLAALHLVVDETPWRALSADLVPAGLHAVPLALLGVFLGRLYLGLGPVIAVLMVVPMLVTRRALASTVDTRSAHAEALALLVRALEAKDPYTAGHTERVARYADLIGAELGFRRRRASRLRVAALMHDIGKLVVPNHLLNKPGPLTAAEYERVRAHEHVGVEMLRMIDRLAPIATHTVVGDPSVSGRRQAGGHDARDDARDAENPDSVESRIIAVADAYDAMTSTRSYRRALSQDVAFRELRSHAGTQFDDGCVEALIAALERSGERHGAGHETTSRNWGVAPPARGVGSASLGDLDLTGVDLTPSEADGLDLADAADAADAMDVAPPWNGRS